MNSIKKKKRYGSDEGKGPVDDLEAASQIIHFEERTFADAILGEDIDKSSQCSHPRYHHQDQYPSADLSGDSIDILASLCNIDGPQDMESQHHQPSKTSRSQEFGQADEYLPYKRPRRRQPSQPNSRSSQQAEALRRLVKKRAVRDHEKLLIVKRSLDHFNLGDMSQIKKIIRDWLSEDCELYLVPCDVSLFGKNNFRVLLEALYASFPDGIFLASDTTVSEGGRVRTRFSFTGVQALDFSLSTLIQILGPSVTERPSDVRGNSPLMTTQTNEGLSLSEGLCHPCIALPSVVPGTSNLDTLADLVCARLDDQTGAGYASMMEPSAGSVSHISSPGYSLVTASLPDMRPGASSGSGSGSAQNYSLVTESLPAELQKCTADAVPYKGSSEYSGTSIADEHDEADGNDDEGISGGEEVEVKLLPMLSSHGLILTRPTTAKILGAIEITLTSHFLVEKITVNWKEISASEANKSIL